MELNALLTSFQRYTLPLITVQNAAYLVLAFLMLAFYALKISKGYATQKVISKKLLEEKKEYLVTVRKLLAQNKSYKEKYSAIIDINVEIKKITDDNKKNTEKVKAQIKEDEKKIEKLRIDYRKKKLVFDELVQQAAIYNEDIELAELGFYKPRFDFDTSEEYKQKIATIKTEQKKLISKKEAIFCNTVWTTDGSRSKERQATSLNIRLTARAFNNECDHAMSNIRWNNAERIVQRVIKAFESINKLNKTKQTIRIYQLNIYNLRLAN